MIPRLNPGRRGYANRLFPPRTASLGFTLVEAIVALAVVAMSLAAIGHLTSGTLRSAGRIDSRVALAAAERRVIAGLAFGVPLAESPAGGMIDGHRWRLDAEPLGAMVPKAGAAWIPERVELTVEGPTGVRASVEMIRLVRPRPQ